MKTDLDSIVLEELNYTIPCESVFCHRELNKPSHDADWLIHFKCGCFMHWCNHRFIIYGKEFRAGRGINCTQCGSGSDAGNKVVGWAPLH